VSYVFQSMLIDSMRQYAMIAAEEYLSKSESDGEWAQRESLQAESDAELADDVVCAWTLDDMDSNALRRAFAELRTRLLAS
jgi:hypothetical protein